MDIYHLNKDEKAAENDPPFILNEKMRKKMDALIDDPKITINGKEIHYRSFEEFKNSKHYCLMLAIMRMLGGGKHLREFEQYAERRIQDRQNQDHQQASRSVDVKTNI